MNPESSCSDVASASGCDHDDLLITTISTINDGNGVDIDGILEVLESSFEKSYVDGKVMKVIPVVDKLQEKYELPPDYRKVLEEDLNNLVSQKKLEKETRYKILDATVTQATNPTQIMNPQELVLTSLSSELREKAEAAAKALAVSDNKDLEAKEASELADKTEKLYERSLINLEIAQELHDRCAKGEEVVLLP